MMDFIQKDNATFCYLKDPLSIFAGIGKGSSDIAKKLCIHHLFTAEIC